MKEKPQGYMYALTFCYEANNGNEPYAATLAVSNDLEKIKEKLQECVKEDCEINEEDEFDDNKNYVVYLDETERVGLQHKTIEDLYTMYYISLVQEI